MKNIIGYVLCVLVLVGVAITCFISKSGDLTSTIISGAGTILISIALGVYVTKVVLGEKDE